MIQTLRTCVFCVIAFSGPVCFADANGRYIEGGAAGGVTCPEFVDSFDKGRQHGLGTLGYVNQIQGFANYIAGYKTAFNRQTPDTCDIFDGVSPDQMLAWTANYCRSNPLEKFYQAVNKLADERYGRRRKSC